MSFNSPRIQRAMPRLQEIFQANMQEVQRNNIARRLEDQFDDSADEKVDVVHPERSLDENALPDDTTQREKAFKDFIKAFQEDNKKLRADVSRLIILTSRSDNGIKSQPPEKRLQMAINDTSLDPYDGVKVRNSANWTERFVDHCSFYHLTPDLALELFKRKLKDDASEIYSRSNNLRAKTSIEGAFEWLDGTWILHRKLLIYDKWNWEKENFETFLSRFNSHFGAYDALDSDRMD